MTTRQKESRGLGRKTKEEIGKWNQMTALRFQTGEEKHQISPASLQGNSLYFDKLISQCENRACAHFSISWHWWLTCHLPRVYLYLQRLMLLCQKLVDEDSAWQHFNVTLGVLAGGTVILMCHSQTWKGNFRCSCWWNSNIDVSFPNMKM